MTGMEQTGELIGRLRRQRGLTQRQLAEALGVSDKAVSKWERGHGCPDIALIPGLAAVLGVSADTLLAGEAPSAEWRGASMRKARWFVCPACGNVIMATGPSPAQIACCGRSLDALEARKAPAERRLHVDEADGALSVWSDHPMTKEDFVSFVALIGSDRAQVVRTYPEWDLRVRFERGHGLLVWYGVREGLLYQTV